MPSRNDAFGRGPADTIEMTDLPVFIGLAPFGRNAADLIATANLLVFIAMAPEEVASSDSIGGGPCGPRRHDYFANCYRAVAMGTGVLRPQCDDFIAMTNLP